MHKTRVHYFVEIYQSIWGALTVTLLSYKTFFSISYSFLRSLILVGGHLGAIYKLRYFNNYWQWQRLYYIFCKSSNLWRQYKNTEKLGHIEPSFKSSSLVSWMPEESICGRLPWFTSFWSSALINEGLKHWLSHENSILGEYWPSF